jgi:hypothetical protein
MRATIASTNIGAHPALSLEINLLFDVAPSFVLSPAKD